MKKINNEGFLLSESLIVSTFVMTVIMLMFVQFKGVIVNNKKQYTYNNVEDIYSLGSFAEFWRNNQKDGNALQSASLNNDIANNGYYQIYGSGSCVSALLNSSSVNFCNTLASNAGLDYVFVTDSDISSGSNTRNKIIDSNSVNQDMKDFVDRINTDKIDGKKRLIAKFLNGDFATVVISDRMVEPVQTLDPNVDSDGCSLNNVTINLDPDGGNVTPNNITGLGTSTYGSSLPTPTKSGNTFDGWYDGTEKVESTSKLCNNKTLKAHWTVDTLKTIYTPYINDSSFTCTPSNSKSTEDRTCTKDENSMTLNMIKQAFQNVNYETDGNKSDETLKYRYKQYYTEAVIGEHGPNCNNWVPSSGYNNSSNINPSWQCVCTDNDFGSCEYYIVGRTFQVTQAEFYVTSSKGNESKKLTLEYRVKIY